MITLSFSTIKNCLQPENSHNWVNKKNRVKFPENDAMRLGKELHREVQNHFAGNKIIKELGFIEDKFPVVEQKDFDERCRFYMQIDGDFAVQGFVDGKNLESKDVLEMKFVRNKLWSVSDFNTTYQKKLIALCMPTYKRFVGFTAIMPEKKKSGGFDYKIWKINKPKLYPIEFTEADRKEAREWIKKAMDTVVSGHFDGGLEDGVCTNRYCYYGVNCMFK